MAKGYRPVILQLKFFPTKRALSILRQNTGENFPKGTVQIFNNNRMRRGVPFENICLLLYSPWVSVGLIRHE